MKGHVGYLCAEEVAVGAMSLTPIVNIRRETADAGNVALERIELVGE